MNRGPVVVREGTREWETWPDEEVGRKGLVYWKTLVSADVTRSEALTMGIGRVPPGEALRTHRHLPPEIYLVLEGTGSVEIGPDARPVEAGSAVFIPGDAPTPWRTRGRRICGSLTSLPRIRSTRSSTSSRSNIGSRAYSGLHRY